MPTKNNRRHKANAKCGGFHFEYIHSTEDMRISLNTKNQILKKCGCNVDYPTFSILTYKNDLPAFAPGGLKS